MTRCDCAPQESILSPLDRRSEAYKHIAAQVHPPRPQQQPKRQPLLTLPNVLTFVRLVMVPIVIALWELEWRFSPITVGVIFILAALTDWLDGYLARTVRIFDGHVVRGVRMRWGAGS